MDLLTSIVPLAGSSNPAMIWSRVDLPHPDGPRKTKNSPCSTSSVMPPSATTSSLVRSIRQTLPISLSRRMLGITDSLCAQPLRRPRYGGDNVLITRAAAQVAAQSLAYIVFRRRRILIQKLKDRHKKPWRAKSALETQRLQKSLLNRVKRRAILGFRQSLHRQDR